MKSLRIKLIGHLIITVSILFAGFAAAYANPPDFANSRYIAVCEEMISTNECVQVLHQNNAEVLKPLPLINGVAVNLPPHVNPAAVAAVAGVLRLDPDTVHFAVAETVTWNIRRINADQAWGTTTGSGVKVGILDTGIDSSHPDLKERIAGGIDTIRNRSWTDNNGHGTHVGGIVAATANNGIGIAGVAPQAGLYAVRVLSTAGSGYTSDIIEGIDWCMNSSHKCDVMNMSFGSPSYNQSFQDAINKAHGAGIVAVAAAGNDGTDSLFYPAAYNYVVAVSATDQNDNIPYWSNYGNHIDFAAPGSSIYSTYKKGSYATMSGTSMASPHVAGVAALRIQQYRDAGISYTPEKVESDIAAATKPETRYNPYYYGSGIPDAQNLVNLQLTQ